MTYFGCKQGLSRAGEGKETFWHRVAFGVSAPLVHLGGFLDSCWVPWII